MMPDLVQLSLGAFALLMSGLLAGVRLRDWQRGRWESWDFPERPDR